MKWKQFSYADLARLHLMLKRNGQFRLAFNAKEIIRTVISCVRKTFFSDTFRDKKVS